MKPEELVSKELSMWKERPARPVSAEGALLEALGLASPGVDRLAVCGTDVVSIQNTGFTLKALFLSSSH